MSKRRKKKKINYFKLSLLIFVVVLVLAIIIFGSIKIISNYKQELPKEEEKDEPVIEEKVYTANLIMVGDALIHSSVYNDANRLANYNGYDFRGQIELIKEKTQSYDIAYYNQETILGGTSIGLSDYPTFNSPQEYGDAMIDAGFNLVSLATNHTIDRGERAIALSREYWNNQEGVQAVGSYTSNEEKTLIETKVLEVNNITYAMLNYTYGTNGITVPSGKEYLVNVWPTDLYLNDVSRDTEYQAYKETVKEDINAIRDKVDVLLVAMHWGVEYTHTPTAYEKDMAQFLAENGVDIVIGTHPHVIQPVEWIYDTIVFYSLGNFISAQYQNQGSCSNYKCMIGLMSSLTITKTVLGDDIDITIDNIENELIYTYYYRGSSWQNFKVIPFSNSKIKEYLPNYQEVYNTYASIIEEDDERITTVPITN